MTKRLEWTEKHWRTVERVIYDNGTMPWYAAKYQLAMSSSNITPSIADEVIRAMIRRGRVEVVRRGSTRRKGNLYLRKPDRHPRVVTADDLAELRRM